MATLRHGMPVEVCGYFQKQGAHLNRFPRYLHLCDVVLSNAHSSETAPTWYVNVLHNPMVPGPNLHEFLVSLPTRTVSYFACSETQYTQWIFALDQVRAREMTRYYSVGRILGTGAFSTVRFIEDRITRDKYAVKEIDKSKVHTKRKKGSNNHNHNHCSSGFNGYSNRLKEVEIMLRLQPHPNIVNTYDIFENLRHIYLIIEYMEGGELFDIIADNGHLSERNAAQVLKEIIVAVRYLHSNGIVHCDIKPENILCTTKTWPLNIKLCDFGLANITNRGTGNTNGAANTANDDTANGNGNSNGGSGDLTSMIGTPGYCAPEVVCKKNYGAPVDMWAIGVILYILLSGRMPFYGRSDVETLRRTALGQYSFPEREWANISEDAKSLVKGLLQLNPAKRLTAEAALHHGWLKQLENLSTKPIENDLSGLHSRLRKFRKAARAAMLVERIKGLMNQSNSAKSIGNSNSDGNGNSDAGNSNCSSPLPPNSTHPNMGSRTASTNEDAMKISPANSQTLNPNTTPVVSVSPIGANGGTGETHGNTIGNGS